MTKLIPLILLLISLTVSTRILLQGTPSFANSDCPSPRIYSFRENDANLDTFDQGEDGKFPAPSSSDPFTLNPDEGDMEVKFLAAAAQPGTGDIYVIITNGTGAQGFRFVAKIGAQGFRENEVTKIGDAVDPFFSSITFNCKGELFGIEDDKQLFPINITSGEVGLPSVRTGDCGAGQDDCTEVLLYNYDNDALYRISSSSLNEEPEVVNTLFIINEDGTDTRINITDDMSICIKGAVDARISAATYIGDGLAIISCGLNPQRHMALFQFPTTPGGAAQIVEELTPENLDFFSVGLIPTVDEQDLCTAPLCIDNGNGGNGTNCSDSSSDSSDSSSSDDVAADGEGDDRDDSDSSGSSDDDSASDAMVDSNNKDNIEYTNLNHNDNHNHNHNADLNVRLSESTLINIWAVAIIGLLLNLSICWCFHKNRTKKTVYEPSTLSPLP